jgi:hypothetical protein
MGATPEITVLLPVRNAGAWLAEAVASTLDNDRQLQVVVIDDASDDGAVSALAASRLGDKIELLRPGRVGLAGALAIGLQHARAPWLARMDADDISAPHRLDRSLATLEALPPNHQYVVSCAVQPFSDAGEVSAGMQRYCHWINGLRTPSQHWRGRLVEQPLANPTTIAATEAVRAVGGFRDGPFPEDYDLWLRLFAKGARFHKLPDVMLQWRDHASRFTRRNWRCKRDRVATRKADHMLLTWPELAAGNQAQIIGAGDEAKLWCDLLAERRVDVQRAFDIGRRVGGKLRGRVDVVDQTVFAEHLNIPTLVAVSRAGGRDEIRQQLQQLGLTEARDFYCVC